MIDWIQTTQGVAAILAALVASIVAWWNLGLPGIVFSPKAAITPGSMCSSGSTATPGS